MMRTVRVWDLSTGRCVDKWPLWDSVLTLAIEPTSRYIIAAAGWDLVAFTIDAADE